MRNTESNPILRQDTNSGRDVCRHLVVGLSLVPQMRLRGYMTPEVTT
jgi:hypothetical protein